MRGSIDDPEIRAIRLAEQARVAERIRVHYPDRIRQIREASWDEAHDVLYDAMLADMVRICDEDSETIQDAMDSLLLR